MFHNTSNAPDKMVVYTLFQQEWDTLMSSPRILGPSITGFLVML
jgi:hypothetical protein